MHAVEISLLFLLFYTSFVLPLTDVHFRLVAGHGCIHSTIFKLDTCQPSSAVNVTDTVRKLYGECFEIFVHMAMFLHGNLNVTEIPSEMLGPASFCLDKYSHLCQRGTVEEYVATQQDSSSSFQGDIIYETVMNWRNFINGSLTYQEAYCMIRVITIMMNHSEVSLCSVLSICSAALNTTRCEETYTDLVIPLQENCHLSSEDSECKIVYTYNSSCVVSTVVAVLCGIVALLAGGTYLHLKYFKKTDQSCKCGQQLQPHFSLRHSAPLEDIPLGQQVCTPSGSDHRRRIIPSANIDIPHVAQHHHFEQEIISPQSFLNRYEEYNHAEAPGDNTYEICSFRESISQQQNAEAPGDNTYEICSFRESISQQQNENVVEYMEPLQLNVPEYLEILPDLPDYNNVPILAERANQQQIEFADIEHQYAMVGEIVRSGQRDRKAKPFEKEMGKVNESFQSSQQQIYLKTVVAKDTNLEESDRLDKSPLSEELSFTKEFQEGEHVQKRASTFSLTDELIEIVIQNENQLFSENSASPSGEMISLTQQGNFSQRQQDSDV